MSLSCWLCFVFVWLKFLKGKADQLTNQLTVVDAAAAFNQGEVQSVQQKQAAEVAGDRKYAQATFEMADAFANGIVDGSTIQIGDETYTFAVGKDSAYTSLDNVIDMTDKEVDGTTGVLSDNDEITAAARLSTAAVNNEKFFVTSDTTTDTISLTEKAGAFSDYETYDLENTAGNTQDGKWEGLIKTGTADVENSGTGLTLQIGDTSDDYNKLEVSVDSMKAADLFNGTIDISEQGLAQDAIDTIKNAINTVSAQRGRLGAIQNRLEHTANNLSVMEENITDAESTIRDTDVADEMMAYTKNNILIQTSQAMLAQANMVPQGVLSLLQ